MKVKTQEIKKKVLKSMKLDRNGKKLGKEEPKTSEPLPIYLDEPDYDSDDNESLDSDQEVSSFLVWLLVLSNFFFNFFCIAFGSFNWLLLAKN
jgi:hypothetical protein